MPGRRFSREFKLEAVKLVKARGVSTAQASRDLGLHENVLRNWVQDVAVVLDLYSRRAVGWSMQSSMTTQLVTDAPVMAIWRRGKPDALLHHSDRAVNTAASSSSACWASAASPSA